MALLEIFTLGEEVLKKKADPVDEITEDIKELAASMVETMHNAPGIGLAAPQVGKSIRLIIVDLSVGRNPDELIVLINPEIIESEGEVLDVEGCLSVPGINEKVLRPARVVVKGLDTEGREKIIEANDYMARALCHEIDHLEGKLFIDYLSPLKRKLIKGKFRKEKDKRGKD